MEDTGKERPKLSDDLLKNKASLELWRVYAKDRYDAISVRVDDLRNRARQMVAIVGVVIGLELNAVARIPEGQDWHSHYLRIWCLVFLVVGICLQTVLLYHLITIGYRGKKVREPEKPSQIGSVLVTSPEPEAIRMIAAYYSKSYDELYDLADTLAVALTRSTVGFVNSLGLFLLGVLILVCLALVP